MARQRGDGKREPLQHPAASPDSSARHPESRAAWPAGSMATTPPAPSAQAQAGAPDPLLRRLHRHLPLGQVHLQARALRANNQDSGKHWRRRPAPIGPQPAGLVTHQAAPAGVRRAAAPAHLRHMLAVALRPQARQHAAAADAVQQLVQALGDDAWGVGGGRAGRKVAATAVPAAASERRQRRSTLALAAFLTLVTEQGEGCSAQRRLRGRRGGTGRRRSTCTLCRCPHRRLALAHAAAEPCSIRQRFRWP